MRIFFTGVTSFSGRPFFNRLVTQGHEVVGASSRTDEFGCQIDLAQKDFQEHLPGGHFDALVHFASHVPLSEQSSRWADCAPVNVYGTIDLLRALEGRVGRVLLASSCAVYGAGKITQPATEAHPLRPDNAYALSKYAQEQIVQAFCRSRNLPYAIMRLGYVYGPGLNPNRALVKFINALREGREIELVNPRGAGLHLIHVDDIARIGVELLHNGSGSYNVVMPGHITLMDFVETAAEVLGKKANIVEHKGAAPLVTNYYDSPRLRAMEMLPEKSLNNGICSLLEGA